MAILFYAIAVILIVRTTASDPVAKITRVEPRYGSSAGGTKFQIFGSDFDVELYLGDSSEKKSIQLQSESKTYDCKFHDAESDENQAVCYTNEMDEDTYNIVVKMRGIQVQDSMICNGNKETSCTFTVVSWRTPLLRTISHAACEPGEILNLAGRIYTPRTASSEEIPTNNVDASIVRVYTVNKCDLYDGTTNEKYGTGLDSETSRWGWLLCKMTGSYVGYQNISFIVDNGYGRSKPYLTLYHISASGITYMLQTFAVVTGVSPSSGATTGEQLISISGRNFDNSSGIAAEVLIGGKVCKIQTVTSNEITCLTPSEPDSKTAYSGGRGLRQQFFESDSIPLAFDAQAEKTILVDNSSLDASENYTLSRGQAFFVPPYDGTYRLCYSGHGVQLYFNPNGSNPNDATKHTLSGGIVNGYVCTSSHQLTRGSEYYFAVYNILPSDPLKSNLGFYTEESAYTSEQTSEAISDVQTVQVDTSPEKEVQKFTLTDWPSVAEGGTTTTIWTVELNCLETDCLAAAFTLKSFEVKTAEIRYSGITANDLAVALEDLIPLHGEVVTVTVINENSPNSFRIEILSSRGNIPLAAESSSNLQVTLTSTQEGTTIKSGLTFMMNGYVSNPVFNLASTDDIERAVQSLFGPICSPLLGEEGNKHEYYDMETASPTSGGTKSSEKSFCGSFSMKNPTYIYSVNDAKAFRVTIFPEVCFAYNGDISKTIRVTYYTNSQINDIDNTIDYLTTSFTVEDLVDSIENWSYLCFNLYELFPEASQADSSLKVKQIQLYGGSDEETDLFVDNIFIGSKGNIQLDKIQSAIAGRQPSAVPHIKLESVKVSKDGDNYAVTFNPIDCGNNFPLLGFAFTSSEPVDSAEGKTYPFGTSNIAVSRESTASLPVTGTFDLSVNDVSINNIAANASAESLTQSFKNNAFHVDVERTGTCYGYTWKIKVIAPGGKYPLLENPNNNLASIPNNITIVKNTDGGLLMAPIQGEFLRTVDSKPQVFVSINGIPSQSSSISSSNYEWDESLTPQVTSMLPLSLPVGGALTLTGTGFSSTLSENIVAIGGTMAEVTAASDTQLQINVPSLSGGDQEISLVVKNKGRAEINISTNRRKRRSTPTIHVQITVNSVDPVEGSVYGGTSITISGKGFSSDTTVTIKVNGEEEDCQDIDISSTKIIKCVTPAGEMGNTTILIKDKEHKELDYMYIEPSGSITTLSSQKVTASGGALVSINGSGLKNALGVFIGQNYHNADMLTWTASSSNIQFRSPPLSHGDHRVDVVTAEGIVSNPYNLSLQVDFSITSITQAYGSLMGGTSVTIEGTGFETGMEIKFGEVNCTISEVAEGGNNATCVVGSCTKQHDVTNSGMHPTYGRGYAWDPENLEIAAGAKVRISWSLEESQKSIKVGIKGANGDYVFGPEKANEASYTVQFGVPGEYNILGDVNDPVIEMRRNVTVIEASIIKNELIVKLGDIEADNPNNLTFECKPDLSATITSMSPNEGKIGATISIQGTYLDNAEVTFGGKECAKISGNSTSITCNISASEELAVGNYKVVVKTGTGEAINEIRHYQKKRFTLLPHITSISPCEGSLEGGTMILIEGSGFSSKDMKVTWNDEELCETLESIKYGSFICVTKNRTAGSGSISVSVGAYNVSYNSCEFSFSEDRTPTVSSVENVIVYENVKCQNSNVEKEKEKEKIFTFNGTGFGTTVSNITVTFVSLSTTYADINQDCVVDSVTDSKIVCKIAGVIAGDNQIYVRVRGKGLAAFSQKTDMSFNENGKILCISPNSGSVMGGTEVTIYGNGFANEKYEVTVGGVKCKEKNWISPTEMTCITPISENGAEITTELVVLIGDTSYHQEEFAYTDSATPYVLSVTPPNGVQGDNIILTGTNFGTNIDDVAVTISGRNCDVRRVDNTFIECTLEEQGNTTKTFVNVRAKGYAIFEPFVVWASMSPKKGGFGGGQPVTLKGTGFSENTVVKFCGIKVEIDDVQFTDIRIVTPPIQPENNDITCEVSVINGDHVINETDAYTYQPSETFTISGVQPQRGGTAGGTRLTITIDDTSNLLSSTQPSNISVKIDGSSCDVTSFTGGSTINCTTTSHVGSIEAEVEVSVEGLGKAYPQDASFYYVDQWSSVYTWGGDSLPKEGEFIIIQEGQTVLLDTNTTTLLMLLINGGTLIFDEEQEFVELNAENILITNGGSLQIGTKEKCYDKKAIITMHGHLLSPELPIYGAKTLGVRSGNLSLYGCPMSPTWTKLNQNVSDGAKKILLEQKVNWPVGSEIVIASTGLRHSQSENEKRIITAVSDDGMTLTLNKELDYKHAGEQRSFGDTTVKFTAEVGVLTRNIVFRGSSIIDWKVDIPKCEAGFQTGQFATQTCFQGRFGEETGSDEFGASLMIHSKSPTSFDVLAYIENVEFTYVGQAFRLGRYPVHWHLMGNVSERGYVRGCSVHNSFNRAIVIHGTHNLLVESNVVYDIRGGAIFIEDGIETKNVIQYNLAVFVRQSTSLLNDDITPAAYWVTNPDNVLRHNHAAGGTHFGFWYRMHKHPDGPSFTTDVCQQNVELGEFFNNTVHSQGWFGLWIFQDYFPMVGGSCNSNTPSPAKFKSLTTWNCEKGAEWVNCGAIQFIDFVVINNEDSGLDLKLITGTGWGEEGSMIKNITVVGQVSTGSFGNNDKGPRGIVLPMSPGLSIETARFFDFGDNGVVFIGTTIQGKCVVLCGGFYYWVKDLGFSNVKKRLQWRWLHEGVIWDRDGSLTGQGSPKFVVPHSGIMNLTICQNQTGDTFSSGEIVSAFCETTARFHRFALNNVLPSSLQGKDLIVENAHGNTSSTFEKKRLTHPEGWMILLQGRETYTMWFQDGEQFTNISFNSRFYDFKVEDFLIFGIALAQTPDVITMNEGTTSISAITDNPLSFDTSSNLDYSFQSDTKTLQQILMKKDTSRRRRALEIVDEEYAHFTVTPRVYRCYYENCTAPVNANAVSSTQERPENFQYFSQENSSCIERDSNTSSVTIKATAEGVELCWVVLDQNVNVRKLTIFGVLQANHTIYENVTMEARVIVVLGGRFMAGGSADEPFLGRLDINMVGDHSTESYELSGITLGSKALGCFGGCDFYGKPVSRSWTYLSKRAVVGATQITIEEGGDGWEVGAEILIATTGYDSVETEKRTITSVSTDGRTIGFVEPLLYRHLNESYTVGSHSFDMKAEVGLLSRNIKIKGVSYDKMEEEAFGARVLIGDTSDGEDKATGWGRFSNVEFYQTGQEGWTEPYDPRFSLAWVNTGTATDAPSYVFDCAFHDGFSTAIGAFGANGINITRNVVHRTIHDGIRLTGDNHNLVNNLVSDTRFRGTWHTREELNNFMDWHANFKVVGTTRLTMIGNRAAGSERIGFHIDGEACKDTEIESWKDNTAHGCLHGIHMLHDGVGDCSLIRNFLVYKSWDYGIYHQTSVSIIVRDCILVDNKIGYFPLIYGPAATSHTYKSKFANVEGLLCVGKSEHFDPNFDTMDESKNKNLKVRDQPPSQKAPSTSNVGEVCIMLPLFQSSPNGAPFKPFHANMNYPAIRGLLNITGLHADNYKDDSRVFCTNPGNEDIYHPTTLRNTTLSNVDDKNMVYIQRPSLGLINPSDCVDMECDGMKKVLIKDIDGTFLGNPGAVIPEAEYEWNGDPRRGLGDYRIPKPMLTYENGSMMAVSEIANHTGIIRNEDCTKNAEWQAYDCSGDDALDYQMLVIESMDSDTETRRLSPVALLGDGYIDLNNGPQDHGWCFGYTCQKRISTFYTIVAADTHFDLYFTGYAPRDLRLQLLNVDDSKTIRLAIWYARPEELKVIRTESRLRVFPTNSRYDADEESWVEDPQRTEEQGLALRPAINSSVHGENFIDRNSRLFYITLRGSEPVEIITLPTVMVQLGVKAVAVDDFFETNLVKNLINFLNVPSEKVRIVNVVSESRDNSRKRRSTSGGTMTFTIAIGESVFSDSNTTDADSIAEDLNTKAENLLITFQNETLYELLNISSIDSFSMSLASTSYTNTNQGFLVEHKIPRALVITSIPSTAEELQSFPTAPVVTIVDDAGDVVTTLGSTWEVTVTLNDPAGTGAVLEGTTTRQLIGGNTTFVDLSISLAGNYSLHFEITSPSGVTVTPTDLPITVQLRTVLLSVTGSANGYYYHGESVDLTLQLNGADNQPLSDVGYKGLTWKAAISLDDPSIYGSTEVAGTTTFTFNNVGQVVTNGLSLTHTMSYYRYTLLIRVDTEPRLYDFAVESGALKFISQNEMTTKPSGASLTEIVIELQSQPYIQRSSTSQTIYETLLHNYIAGLLSPINVLVENFVLTPNGDGNTDVTFTMVTVNDTQYNSSLSILYTAFVVDGTGLSFNGMTVEIAAQSCPFLAAGICYTKTDDPTDMVVGNSGDSSDTWKYVVIGVAVALVFAILAITFACVLKRANTNNKIGTRPGCLDADSSRGPSPVIHSIATESTSYTPTDRDNVRQPGGYQPTLTPVSV